MQPTSFPPISPFRELLQHHEQDPTRVVLKDHNLKINATTGQILHSVAVLRDKLQQELELHEPSDGKHGDQFIFTLVPIGWEYIVSMLAIISLDAAIAPLSIVVLPDQARRYIELAKPVGFVYSSSLAGTAMSIQQLCNKSETKEKLPFIRIQTEFPTVLKKGSIGMSKATEPGKYAGSLFFTSGTSGNQKGVVHTYQALLASSRERISTWQLNGNDVVLNQKPGNWMGGIFGILPALVSGACLETCANVFDPKFFWERIRQGGLSVFDVAPIGYDRLIEYFDEHIAVLAEDQREEYVRGIVNVKVAGVSGSLLPAHTQERWTNLRRGKPLLNLYGSTEVTLICGMDWNDPRYEDMCCIGQAVPGVEVKLVNGEMRLKAPTMFYRYLSNDQTLTEKSFDEDGYFITGDCAEKIGDSYKLHGRANIDVLHFWGFTVHTGEVENALLSLPYVGNAVVFPLEGVDQHERVAAVIVLKNRDEVKKRSLVQLRGDLGKHTSLMEFKRPTVIYWLSNNDIIPLTANGKVSKIMVREKYFGDGWEMDSRTEILDTKTMQYWRMGGQV